MENLRLIVGLGNPGPDYAATRHNIGFVLVDRLASAWKAGWKMEKKFNARLATAEWAGKRVLLCQPQTFMNESGEAVGKLARFYQLPAEQILVAVDDADLPLGQIRLRPEGSSGGHHGLESIERQWGSRSYPRLRLGIGRAAEDNRQITNYVLGPFSAAERPVMAEVLDRVGRQVECWLGEGIAKAMSQFNGAAKAPSEKGKK